MTERQTTIRAFNINDCVIVKFTAASLKLWQEHAAQMRAAFPEMAYLWPLDPPTDADGFYRGQFWSVMHLVSPELIAGGSAFENSTIYLEFAKNDPDRDETVSATESD
jgi:hypothetical protein